MERSDAPELRERFHQQHVVAEFGQQALNADDLDRLIHEACTEVAATLDIEYCGVFERHPGGNDVVLRDGLGWRESEIGSAKLSTDADSQVGYTLATEEPVVVEDLRTEDRFSGSALIAGHDVVSGMSVIVGPVEDPWGVLSIHSTEPRAFTDYDVDFVRSIANVLASAIERTERTRERDRAHQRMEVALHVRDATVWEWEPGSDAVVTHPSPHGLFGTEVRTLDAFLDPVHPSDRSRVRAALDEAVATGDPYRVEFRYLADEAVRWAEDYGEVVEPTDGDGPRMIGIVRDITDRKRRELELEEANWRYRELVNHFPNGAVALFDEDLRFTATGGELLDEPGSDDPRGKTLQEHYPDEIVTAVEPHFQAALAGEASEFEVEYLDRYFLGRTVPVRNVANEQFAGMIVLLDVTEQRKYRRRLEESHERLEEFASAISHDLRGPLGTVANYLQLLERRYEDEIDEDGEEFIDFAIDGAQRMQEMIDGLVSTYARIDAAEDPSDPVDLGAALDAVLVDLQAKIEANDAEITVDSLPTVAGDPGQLRQLLLNLLDNAIKYAGDEPPSIHVSAEREGDWWVISVSDDGIGMDPDATDQAFEVFNRLHPEEEYPGTGIGLALCERIVERHGGEIWAESAPGEGSTFSFRLPAGDCSE